MPNAAFHPEVSRWFAARYGEPTEVQSLTWPLIAAGKHVLACAPTGSGKTLTAFLSALDRLLTRQSEPGRLRVLYVSPLKALNNDVQRNLLSPLGELRVAFERAGLHVPQIRVVTRSGDTPSNERQRMVRKPPEILITTPESLNILLASKGGRHLLETVETVILDEIHAVAGNKRGTHLATAVERLAHLAGEFQRIALSATVRPIERIANLVAGFEISGKGDDATYTRRPIEIVQTPATKQYDLQVCAPEAVPVPPESSDAAVWHAMVHDFRNRIEKNRSTLVFANSRRLAEKLTRLLNEAAGTELAYAHHGSLSREVRAVVEKRLKEGKLKAIVATSSLELGIDIGALDEVLLAQSPPSVSSAIQRFGRAGHGVGEVSRGRIYPSHDRDFLDAAVLVRSVLDGDIEPARVVEAPLDVLAQVILAMTAVETWHVDELYAFIRTADPYRDLQRRQFDLVIDMLAGRYAGTRLKTLKARLYVDRVDGTLRAQEGVPHLLFTAGGTIPDRGYFHLRTTDRKSKLGELDEEFVWERSVGDTFVLGTQTWRVEQITHNDVIVSQASTRSSMAPFWKAEERLRGVHFSEKIARLLEQLEAKRDDEEGTLALLRQQHRMSSEAAHRLVDLLARQRAVTGTALPHRHHIVVEHYADPHNVSERKQVLIHTVWGGEVNRPFAMAIAAAWEERFGYTIEVAHEDDALIVSLPHEFDTDGLLELVSPDRIEELLRRKLEHSGFFGARFRENAGRALLLPRGGIRKRLPLWLNRLRAKKLLAAVSTYGDFPIVYETWRTCLRDELDIVALRSLLEELARGEIAVSEVTTEKPSPFAAQAVYRHTNVAVYEDDRPLDQSGSRLQADLLREVVLSPQLRPRVDPALAQELTGKLQRTMPGYAPRSAAELVECVKERLLLDEEEWRLLLSAVEQDNGEDATPWLAEVGTRVVAIDLGGTGSVCALEDVGRLALALGLERPALGAVGGCGSPADIEMPPAVAEEDGESPDDEAREALLVDIVGQWLASYGPVDATKIETTWGLGPAQTRDLVEALEEAERIVVDQITAGCETLEVCDTDNLETLLRLARARARPSFEPLSVDHLPLFLATHQGLLRRHGRRAELGDALEMLVGFPAPASSWETDLLPARLDPYFPDSLDRLLQQNEVSWIGCGKQKLTFASLRDLDLLFDSAPEVPEGTEILPPVPGRFSLADLSRHSGRSSADLSRRLWELAWAARVTNDTFAAVRIGLKNRFEPTEPTSAEKRRGRPSRRAFGRWRSTRPFVGSWLPTELETTLALDNNPLEEDERNKDRVRLLLGRYGVLFRELAARELPALSWSRIFRALRLMELSGEVLTGRFFCGVPGPQFASHAAFRRLQAGLNDNGAYWMSAVDPASPCGLGLEGQEDLPHRQATTTLSFVGTALVLVSRRNGRDLTLAVEPGDNRMSVALAPLEVMLARETEPVRGIDIETINDEPATESKYRFDLAEHFEVSRGPKTLRLQRRYGQPPSSGRPTPTRNSK